MQTHNKIPVLTRHPLLVSLLFELSLGLLGLILAFFFHIHLWEKIYWELSHVYAALALSFCLFILFLVLYHLPYKITRDIRTHLEGTLYPLFSSFGAFKIFLVALAAGVGEELLFRGFLQNALSQFFGTWPALLISNFFFAFAHWISPFYAIFAGLLGLLLGASMIYFENLLPPILIHTLYDFAALYYFVKRKSIFMIFQKAS